MSNKNSKQAYRENERQGWPAWIWMGLGVLLGLALSALVLIKDWAPMLRRQNLPQPNAAATAPKDGDQALADANTPPPAPKKTYDFYSVLPEMEVVIPDAELTAKAKAEQQRQQATATTPTSSPSAPPSQQAGGHYVLLAGSYTDPRAADEAKAKLAMLGIIAQVQSININGKTWNRVMVGPYANASDTEATKKILGDNGVKAIPMKQASNQ